MSDSSASLDSQQQQQQRPSSDGAKSYRIALERQRTLLRTSVEATIQKMEANGLIERVIRHSYEIPEGIACGWYSKEVLNDVRKEFEARGYIIVPNGIDRWNLSFPSS